MELLDCFKAFDIILASQSPRRHALMKAAGIPFRTMVRPTEEAVPPGMAPLDVVLHLCREKADCFPGEIKDPAVVLITADTIVVHRGEIINKPADAPDAIRMLGRLSGSTHEVYTGVCIRHGLREVLVHDHSFVTFRPLREEEIRHYVAHYAPYDKAGAYGIQDWIGYIGITAIRGSYHNVMGLPIHKVYEVLSDLLCSRP